MSDAYETHFVPGSAGVRLATDIWIGSPKPPVRPGFVLIHGLASNARLYDGVAKRIVGAGHAVATLDLRGHGRSDKPDSGYDYDTMCADVAAVLSALRAGTAAGALGGTEGGDNGFDRPVVVGQSFGGNLVLELAARYPEQVSGIACIDGGVIDLSASHPTWEAVAEALAPPKIAGAQYGALEARFKEAHPDWPAEGIEGSLANFEVRADGTVAPWLSFERHMKILRTLFESSPVRLYATLKVPVLFLPAESSGAAPAWARAKRAAIETAVAMLPQSNVRWFSPADHDVHAQHPDEVAATLLEAAGTLFA